MTAVGAVLLPQFPPELLRGAARAADEAGLAELWLWEDCLRQSSVASAAAALALAAGDYTGTIGFTRVGGVLGIVTALLAWYASSAVVINSTHQRIVLPVGPQQG